MVAGRELVRMPVPDGTTIVRSDSAQEFAPMSLSDTALRQAWATGEAYILSDSRRLSERSRQWAEAAVSIRKRRSVQPSSTSGIRPYVELNIKGQLC